MLKKGNLIAAFSTGCKKRRSFPRLCQRTTSRIIGTGFDKHEEATNHGSPVADFGDWSSGLRDSPLQGPCLVLFKVHVDGSCTPRVRLCGPGEGALSPAVPFGSEPERPRLSQASFDGAHAACSAPFSAWGSARCGVKNSGRHFFSKSDKESPRARGHSSTRREPKLTPPRPAAEPGRRGLSAERAETRGEVAESPGEARGRVPRRRRPPVQARSSGPDRPTLAHPPTHPPTTRVVVRRRRRRRRRRSGPRTQHHTGYLVDPASSICLSQRLSHASLSTHGRYSETANGSLNQLWFL